MKEEFLDIVNEDDEIIGTASWKEMMEKKLLHRTSNVFIFNSKGELLIQQRAKTKYHSGGLWSNTVCSHPKPNETYLQATHRRLKEEMGFDCKLKKLFCFIYNTGFQNGLIENEYDCVFIGKFDGKPKPNHKEIMNYKWISIKELKKDITSHPAKYSIWLKIALNRIKPSQIKGAIK